MFVFLPNNILYVVDIPKVLVKLIFRNEHDTFGFVALSKRERGREGEREGHYIVLDNIKISPCQSTSFRMNSVFEL